jgi:glycosyltransferase involved in cell wall biosynthesis
VRAERPRRIAYVMSRFPKITETFILREMVELDRLGWQVEPFALVREREQVAHPGVETYLDRTRFAAGRRRQLLRANLDALLHRPATYIRLLARTFRHFWRSPAMLARSLICLPIAVDWARVARQEGIAHIHAHFATHATYLAYVMAELAGIGYSFTAHAHDIYLERAMLAEKVRRARVVVTISEYNRQLLLGLCPEAAGKIQVVHGGVDPQTFGPRPPQAVVASPAAPLQIVSVGRLQEYKGMPYLVEACRLLHERRLPFRCVIVGDGPDRPALEDALRRYGLQQQVELAGWLPTSQVAAHLAQADVFVLASVIAHDGRMEGLPTVLMEAQGCGLPVVSTTISGIPELVQSGENGLLVPPRDAIALAEALAYLHSHPQERERMGQSGRARVLRDFDLGENTRRKAELFAATLA